MSEADPGIETRQSDAGPAVETSELGMGFAEDIRAGDLPSDAKGHSDEPTEAPPAAEAEAEPQPDPNSEYSPEAGLRRDDYDRKMAEIARMREDLGAETRRRYAQWEQDDRAPAAQQTPPAQQQQAAAFTPDLATQIAQEAGLDADATAGLHAVQRLNQGQFDSMANEVRQLRELVQQNGQATSQLTEYQNNNLRSQIAKQKAEAERIYGAGSVDTHRKAVAALLNETNPNTGEFYTIVEAVGMLTGKGPDEARAAREQNANARTRARRTANVPSTHATPGANGADRISHAQAIEDIRATM
jgi:hypothetical protein